MSDYQSKDYSERRAEEVADANAEREFLREELLIEIGEGFRCPICSGFGWFETSVFGPDGKPAHERCLEEQNK